MWGREVSRPHCFFIKTTKFAVITVLTEVSGLSDPPSPDTYNQG